MIKQSKMNIYITGILFLFLLCSSSVQCRAQVGIEDYRIEYDKCNAISIQREWLNDSVFTVRANTDTYKDTFLIKASGLYYQRKGERHKFISLQSFLGGDTIIMYGIDYIKSTQLLPISDKYIPERKDTLFGKEVLVYKVADQHSNYSYEEIYFDPKSFLILKHKTLECGDGVLKRTIK